MPGGGQFLFTGPAQEWQFPWGREQQSGELGPAWQTQQVGTQPVLLHGQGAGSV